MFKRWLMEYLRGTDSLVLRCDIASHPLAMPPRMKAATPALIEWFEKNHPKYELLLEKWSNNPKHNVQYSVDFIEPFDEMQEIDPSLDRDLMSPNEFLGLISR